MQSLPVELYTQVLLQLPGRDPTSLKAVVNCLFASTATHAAALARPVWEHLYKSRYTRHVDHKERERFARLGDDWRLLFIERYKLDMVAVQLLDELNSRPQNRNAAASRIAVELSYDVFDVLELVATRAPIPRCFRDPEVDDMVEEPAPHAIPRRFWAKAAVGALLRYDTIQKWIRLSRPVVEGIGFEDIMIGLSTFIGIAPSEIQGKLDELTILCREWLSKEGWDLDSTNPSYDLPEIVTSIRHFLLHQEGFCVAQDTTFYFPFNQFPHYILGKGGRATIPMSIAFVFCAVCRRLGIEAAPTNMRNKVLVHITPPDPTQGGILLDVCQDAPIRVFTSTDPHEMLKEALLPRTFPTDSITPAPLSTIATRIVTNAFATMRGNLKEHRDQYGNGTNKVFYAISVMFASINAGMIQIHPEVADVLDDFPLDAQIVLVDGLGQHLPPAERDEFIRDVRANVESHWVHAVRRPRRRPTGEAELRKLGFRAFVGQVVTHPQDGLACVIGWSQIGPGVGVKYVVLTEKRCKEYGINDVFTPASLSREHLRWLRGNVHKFDQFFEDAYVPREDGVGGYLVPVPQLLEQYPDDVKVARRWSEQVVKASDGMVCVA